MKKPVTKAETLNRYEILISRRTIAAETILDRISRGGYTIGSPQGRAILRKHARLAQTLNTLQTEYQALLQQG